MIPYTIKITSIRQLNHDVLQVNTNKPKKCEFTPGQAAEISINKNGWQTEKRPFTFTSLPDNDYLEFIIKTYPSHKGVTNEMLQLKVNDELVLHNIFGAISYMGDGIFIAGGAGVTPFICILRHLQSKNQINGNKLIFANKTKDDIIFNHEFNELLGDNFINILSEEDEEECFFGEITENFLRINIPDFHKYMYLCGPPKMMDEVTKQLANLHTEEKFIITEKL